MDLAGAEGITASAPDSSYCLIDSTIEGLGQSPDCGQWVSQSSVSMNM